MFPHRTVARVTCPCICTHYGVTTPKTWKWQIKFGSLIRRFNFMMVVTEGAYYARWSNPSVQTRAAAPAAGEAAGGWGFGLPRPLVGFGQQPSCAQLPALNGRKQAGPNAVTFLASSNSRNNTCRRQKRLRPSASRRPCIRCGLRCIYPPELH